MCGYVYVKYVWNECKIVGDVMWYVPVWVCMCVRVE